MAQFSVKIMRLTGSVLGANQQQEHWFEGMEDALRCFGGVPEEACSTMLAR